MLSVSLQHVSPVLAVLFLLSCTFCSAIGQSPTPKESTATISGRVTRNEDNKSSPGVVVAATRSDPNTNIKVVGRATTDADGRYKITGIPPGRYQITPMAEAYVVKDSQGTWPPGRPIQASAGESIDQVDFSLIRGGVITGRVTDGDGRPVVAEQVEIVPADKKQGLNLPFTFMRNLTDDRGIYRIYGLPAGRFHVSVGQDKTRGMVRIGGPNKYYQRTFHPATTDVAQAQVVEVKSGDETTGVDIVVAPASKTFKASGRIVSAENGQPLSDLMFGFGSVQKDQKRVGAYGMTGARTNASGEFQIDGLSPGSYAVFALSYTPEDWYSDAVPFEIDDADASGLEVKVRRGASISGIVTIEGLTDRAAAAQLLPQVQLTATGDRRDELSAPLWGSSKPNPDGTFRISGLRPSKYKISLQTWRMPKGLTLLRVERDGIDQRDGIEIQEAGQVGGVRVHLAYGTAVVRGQINSATGQPVGPQQGIRLSILARRSGSAPDQFMSVPTAVDDRGRFAIEGLPAGEYEIVLRIFTQGVTTPREIKQNVNVTEGGETSIVLVLR